MFDIAAQHLMAYDYKRESTPAKMWSKAKHNVEKEEQTKAKSHCVLAGEYSSNSRVFRNSAKTIQPKRKGIEIGQAMYMGHQAS